MSTVTNRSLNERLRTALEEEQFRLYYQPQIDHFTGRVIGAEALLRWMHPEEGLLTPTHFLRELEASGLIVDVGEWALKKAAMDCARWLLRGLPRLRLGLNFSPAQIAHRHAHPRTFDTGALQACCDLYLEIDRNEISGAPQELIKTLHTMQFEGVSIAVQGFGADDSLRDRLCSLPIDELKVDGAFIRRLTFDNEATLALAGMVALARAFRLALVAEGVETPQQLELLDELGCRQIQGFVYSAPLPADRFEGLLEATTCTPGWARARNLRKLN